MQIILWIGFVVSYLRQTRAQEEHKARGVHVAYRKPDTTSEHEIEGGEEASAQLAITGSDAPSSEGKPPATRAHLGKTKTAPEKYTAKAQ